MKYRHPLTSAMYELRPDGLIAVEDKGVRGVFHSDGRHESGALAQADLGSDGVDGVEASDAHEFEPAWFRRQPPPSMITETQS